MTLYRASQVYEIPKSTLLKKINCQQGVKSSTFVRDKCIPHAEEKVIADCLITMEHWGFRLTKKEILNTIGSYTTLNNIPMPFINSILEHNYLSRFKRV